MTGPLDFDAALLRGLLVAEGFDDAYLTAYFADLADPSKSHNRWQQMVRSGATKEQAKTLRAAFKKAAIPLRRINKYGERIDEREGPLVIQLLARNSAPPKLIGRAMKLADAIAAEGRPVGVGQLLIDEGSLSPEEFVACVEAAGHRVLWCRDCKQHVWLTPTSQEGEPICDECHDKLRPRPKDFGPEVAVPQGYHLLEHARPAVERDGVRYGKAILLDDTGALYEAIDAPGTLLKHLTLPTELWQERPVSGATPDTSLRRDTLRPFRRHLGEARRIEDPHLAAPVRLEVDETGGWLPFDLTAGHLADPDQGRPAPGSPAALRAARDALRGLTALHRAGLVHGAVRPHTIWVTDDGRARLMVTGEHLQPGLEEPAEPAYLPPALAEAPGDADVASDLHGACATVLALHGLDPDTDPAGELVGVPDQLADCLRRGLTGGELSLAELLGSLAMLLPPDETGRRVGSRRHPSGTEMRRQSRKTTTSTHAPSSRRATAFALVFGAIAIAAGVGVALMQMTPPESPGSGSGSGSARQVARVDINEDDRETLGVRLAQGKAEAARQLLHRMTPSPEQRAELLGELLGGLNARTILALSQAKGWPGLRKGLEKVMATEAYEQELLTDVRAALVEGDATEAHGMLDAVLPSAGRGPERAKVLADAVARMSLDRLLELRDAGWAELQQEVAARLGSEETRKAFVARASQQLDRRDFEAAAKTLKRTLGKERLTQADWAHAMGPLDGDALVHIFSETAKYKRRRSIARAAAELLRAKHESDHRDLAKQLTDLSRAELREERYQASIATCTTLLMLSPDDHMTYCRRGICYRLRGKFDAALADFGRSVAIKPDYASGYHQRAVLHQMRKDYAKAASELTEALKHVEPKKSFWATLLTARIVTRTFARDFAGARADIAALRAELTGNSENAVKARDHLAALEAIMIGVEGKAEEARKVLLPLLDKYPGALLQIRGARWINIALGEQLVQLLPKKPHAFVERALARLNYRLVDEGYADMDRAIALCPEGSRLRQVFVGAKGRLEAQRSRLAGEHDTPPDGDW